MPCQVLNDTDRVALEVTYSATLRGNRNQRLRERWESIIIRNMKRCWKIHRTWTSEPFWILAWIINISSSKISKVQHKKAAQRGTPQPGLLSGTGRYGYEESDLPHAATPFWPQPHGLSLVAFDDWPIDDVICSDLSLSSLLFYITIFIFIIYHHYSYSSYCKW
jgi:hypothetical protein